MKKFFLACLFAWATCLQTFAQSDIEMATGLRSSGKIYVVVLVILVIFIGLAIFLFGLDRRITKLEKNQDTK
ncbi:CcmD family protein [Sphingobacteriaceae bacterium WQ 2009]|uniref:CcmD family protein n=1 Tax=Rhinopithecimicrobium faecis TaxID=2820698 RepID=A0A8T4HCT6_9SPHI|nr:CcmD family protein [Sphingobacteriaceae bacterium WQ 2009]